MLTIFEAKLIALEEQLTAEQALTKELRQRLKDVEERLHARGEREIESAEALVQKILSVYGKCLVCGKNDVRVNKFLECDVCEIQADKI